MTSARERSIPFVHKAIEQKPDPMTVELREGSDHDG